MFLFLSSANERFSRMATTITVTHVQHQKPIYVIKRKIPAAERKIKDEGDEALHQIFVLLLRFMLC